MGLQTLCGLAIKNKKIREKECFRVPARYNESIFISRMKGGKKNDNPKNYRSFLDYFPEIGFVYGNRRQTLQGVYDNNSFDTFGNNLEQFKLVRVCH
jgi:hypothetical protein